MIKCPVCKKEISELDEKCPYCHINLDGVIEDVEEPKIITGTNDRRITSADCLNVMANINLILSIMSSIAIWFYFSTTEITKNYTYISGTYTEKVINWYGILGGVAILFTGFTIYFLLKTIVDIYYEVKR